MRMLFLALLATLAPVLAASPSPSPTPRQDFSARAARTEAEHDVAAGHPKIYVAGGYALTEPGITDKNAALVAKLPRDHSLPAGCTAPHAPEACTFAATYNTTVVELLQKNSK